MTRKFILIAVIAAMSAAAIFAEGPVARYGRLFRDGNRIVGEHSGGEAVQLKGVGTQWSSMGWGSDRFFREEAVNAMVDGWNAQVIRASLGIAFNKRPDHRVDDGYNVNGDETGNWGRVKTVVDAAIAKGAYVIIDWHSHTAHDPGETALAIEFFTSAEFAGQYGNHPAVMFEIYNEPEDDVTWPEVKEYAEAVIGAIRGAGFDNLILVGNPRWTSTPQLAADDPPNDEGGNFAIAFHFYTYWYTVARYRSDVQSALDLGFPVFVTEWGTNDASTSGPLYLGEADKWHAYLDSNKISSTAWGVMGGGGNVLYFWDAAGNPLNAPDPKDLSVWIDPAGMTPHGRYVYRWLTGNDTTWAPGIDFPPFTGKRSPIPLPAISAWGSTYNDASAITVAPDDDAVRVAFDIDGTGYEYTPYAGAGFSVDVSMCDYGIGYTYRGSDHDLRAEQSDVGNYAYHINSRSVGSAGDWKSVDIPWSYFLQPSWNTVPVPQNRSTVENITWYVDGNGKSGEFWIKDVWCLGNENGVVSAKPCQPPQSRQADKTPLVRVTGRSSLRVRMPQSGRVSVFDFRGKRVRAMELDRGDHLIRMNDLPRGAYMVRASVSGGSWNGSVRMLIK